MSGFQEILVIVFIITAIVLIPRKQARRPMKRAVSVTQLNKITGKIRALIAATLIYLLMASAYFQPWENDPLQFVYFGIGPVIAVCLAWWVYAGFRKS